MTPPPEPRAVPAASWLQEGEGADSRGDRGAVGPAGTDLHMALTEKSMQQWHIV